MEVCMLEEELGVSRDRRSKNEEMGENRRSRGPRPTHRICRTTLVSGWAWERRSVVFGHESANRNGRRCLADSDGVCSQVED